MSPHKNKSLSLNRRNFIKTTSLAAGAAAFGVPALLRGQNLNSKLNIAQIGAGGKGRSDIRCNDTENIVALCDVDTNSASDAVKSYPSAKFYRDFRVMFDEMASGIDAVGVATPDHFHALAASMAMAHGKHVYCQKPLTQTVYEARYLRNLAHEKKLVTQMGNQGSAADGLRRAVECIQAGIIGQVSQVHIWTNRPIWPQGMDRPAGSDPVPDNLDWDIWLERHRCGLTKRMCTIHSFGVAGRISARERSAIWLVTRSIGRSAPSSSVIRRKLKPLPFGK